MPDLGTRSCSHEATEEPQQLSLRAVGRRCIQQAVTLGAKPAKQFELRFEEIDMAFLIRNKRFKKHLGDMVTSLFAHIA